VLIAHLPAGYLFTKYIQKTTGYKKYTWLGILGSVLPDLDLIYFYYFSDRSVSHHEYLTHMPVFWGVLMFYTVAFIHLLVRNKRAYFAVAIFYANIFLHMLLDSYTGTIKWFYPVFYVDLNLITVPATYDFWMWSFVFHWSFLAELFILTLFMIFIKNRASHVQ